MLDYLDSLLEINFIATENFALRTEGVYRVYRDGIPLTVPRFEAVSGGAGFVCQ